MRAILVASLLSWAVPAGAQPYFSLTEETPVLSGEEGPDRVSRQSFGQSVALSADGIRAVVGAPSSSMRSGARFLSKPVRAARLAEALTAS